MVADISLARLQTQLLSDVKTKSVKEVVAHFGAMQAQDYSMSKWAIGARMRSSTDELIEKALDDGDIIRTHIMRPTWHFVAAEDLHWMLELTSKNILRMIGTSGRQLGLDDKIFSKSNEKIQQVLSGKHLTRFELLEILQHSGFKINETRSSHLLMHAELSGIICNGKICGNQQTYAIIDERVQKSKHFTKEEALAELAQRYFTSHGPATLKDFIWWSGLSVADAKNGILLNEKKLISEEINYQTYYISYSFKTETIKKNVHLLPAFDEFLIAYKDRSASIHNDFTKHAFTNNGIFRPIVVVNGQVVGIWKRTVKNNQVSIEINFHQKTPKSFYSEIEREAQHYADFLNKKLKIKF